MKSLHALVAAFSFSALFLGGCRAQAIDDHAAREIDSVRADTAALYMYATCPDGAPLHASCGLVTRRVEMDDFRATFHAMKCAGDSNDACDAKLERAEEAWLIQRYPLADFRSVDVTCDANPGRCDDGVGRELLLIDSQNLAARALGDRRENDVVARREEAQTRESAMTTDAALLGVVALGTILSHPHHHHHHW